MIAKLMNQMPMGMYDKIRSIPDEEKINGDRLAEMIDECRDEYPAYFDQMKRSVRPVTESSEAHELDPVTAMGIGLVGGYAATMGRKIYDDHYSGKNDKDKKKKGKNKELAEEVMPVHTISDDDGLLPPSIKDLLDQSVRQTIPRFKPTVRPRNPFDVTTPIVDHLLPPIRQQPDWIVPLLGPVKMGRNEMANPGEHEALVTAGCLVAGAVVGAAIADGHVDKVIDATRDYLCRDSNGKKKGKKK